MVIETNVGTQLRRVKNTISAGGTITTSNTTETTLADWIKSKLG